MKKINHYLSLIKFSHSIFALPFALIGFFLGSTQLDSLKPIKIREDFVNTPYEVVVLFFKTKYHLFFLIIVCMIFARSAAMAFNRYLDRNIDAQNPRTKIREIPSGIITPKNAFIFTIACSLAFIACCYFINLLCFYLSFLALTVILGYSYTKRFTPLCHLVLGLGLSLAPIGAYLAVINRFDLVSILFSVIVLFWVSGFDIIYALQDEEFDKANHLKSIPVLLGKKNALLLSRILHSVSALTIIAIGIYFSFGLFYWSGAILFIILLIRQHSIVQADNLSQINMAFFTLNGMASIVFAVFVITDLLFKN